MAIKMSSSLTYPKRNKNVLERDMEKDSSHNNNVDTELKASVI